MKKTNGLRARLLGPILLSLTLIMAVMGFVDYRYSSREMNALMESKGEALTSFLQNVSPPFLTNYDLTALERFVEKAKADPDVAHAAFYDEKGKRLTENSVEPEASAELKIFEKEITNGSGGKIGKLRVVYRTDTLVAVKRRNLLTTVGGLLVSLALLSLVVLGITGKVVSMVGAIAEQLSRSGAQLGNTAMAVVGTSKRLAESSHEQDTALSRSVTALDELNVMIEQTAGNAKQSSDAAGVSRDAVAQGKGVVDGLVQSFASINASNSSLHDQIKLNNQQLREVNSIIEQVRNRTMVINDIVFQTKLLSFNASVEAARAGEHGKGFAVVAEEVGKLAAMSGSAAKEISEMLATSVTKVAAISSDSERQVNKLLDDAQKKNGEGFSMAQRCHEVFNQIAEKVKSAFEMANEIARANQEQARGVQDIQQAMVELKRQMEQNREISRQQSGMADNLNRESMLLHDVMGELTSLVEGSAAARREAAVYAVPASPDSDDQQNRNAA